MAVSLQGSRCHQYIGVDNTQRVFKPLVIFHTTGDNSSPVVSSLSGCHSSPALGSSSPIGGDLERPFSASHLEYMKGRVDDMMFQNSQYWQALTPPASVITLDMSPGNSTSMMLSSMTSGVLNPTLTSTGAGATQPFFLPQQSNPTMTYVPRTHPAYATIDAAGLGLAGEPTRRAPSYSMGTSHMPYRHSNPGTIRTSLHHNRTANGNGSAASPYKPNTKRRRGNLPKPVTAILKAWLLEHVKHPYPTEEEKCALAKQTNLSLNQISNWFINARRRILQPILDQCAKSAAAGGTADPKAVAAGNVSGMGACGLTSTTSDVRQVGIPANLVSGGPGGKSQGGLTSTTGVGAYTNGDSLDVRTVNLPQFRQKLYEQISNSGVDRRGVMSRDQKYKSIPRV
ncbi:Homeobox protein tos8 [Dispira simplex]|nr:Homeobox protein tos8 [Dispira simplex]